MLKQHDNILFP